MMDYDRELADFIESLKKFNEYNRQIEVCDEAADEFIERMFTAKPDPKSQIFLKRAKEYAKDHPIKLIPPSTDDLQITVEKEMFLPIDDDILYEYQREILWKDFQQNNMSWNDNKQYYVISSIIEIEEEV